MQQDWPMNTYILKVSENECRTLSKEDYGNEVYMAGQNLA